MGIDELIEKINLVGVGANVKDIARHLSLLRFAVSSGIVDNESVIEDIENCNMIITQLKQNKLIRNFDYSGTGTTDWPKYWDTRDKEVKEAFKESIYEHGDVMNDNTCKVCLMKKALGASVMLVYCYGELRGMYVKNFDKVGAVINIDNEPIFGVPTQIDLIYQAEVRVYGTLTFKESDKVDVTEGYMATEIAKRIVEDKFDGLQFIPEYIQGIDDSNGDKLMWAESAGFNINKPVIVNCDEYNSDSLLGSGGIELFDFSDDECLECILLMIDDAGIGNDSNNEKYFAAKVFEDKSEDRYKTKVKGYRLDNRNGETVIIASIEKIVLKNDEEVEEVEVTLDQVYDSEVNDELCVVDKGDRLVVERSL